MKFQSFLTVTQTEPGLALGHADSWGSEGPTLSHKVELKHLETEGIGQICRRVLSER